MEGIVLRSVRRIRNAHTSFHFRIKTVYVGGPAHSEFSTTIGPDSIVAQGSRCTFGQEVRKVRGVRYGGGPSGKGQFGLETDDSEGASSKFDLLSDCVCGRDHWREWTVSHRPTPWRISAVCCGPGAGDSFGSGCGRRARGKRMFENQGGNPGAVLPQNTLFAAIAASVRGVK